MNEVTAITVLTCCARASKWQAALLFLKRRCQLVSSLAVYNAALCACQEVGQWRLALDLLDSMLCAGLRPDAISFSAFMSALDKARRWQKALEHLAQRPRRSLVEFNASSSACAKAQRWCFSMCLGRNACHSRLTHEAPHVSAQRGRGEMVSISWPGGFKSCSLKLILPLCLGGLAAEPNLLQRAGRWLPGRSVAFRLAFVGRCTRPHPLRSHRDTWLHVGRTSCMTSFCVGIRLCTALV